MKDFFIVVPALKHSAICVKTHMPSIAHGTRNEAMCVADALTQQTGGDYVVLGVVGRTGPGSAYDNSHVFVPGVASCRSPELEQPQ